MLEIAAVILAITAYLAAYDVRGKRANTGVLGLLSLIASPLVFFYALYRFILLTCRSGPSGSIKVAVLLAFYIIIYVGGAMLMPA